MKYQIEIEEYASHKMIHTFIKGKMSEKARNRVAIETTRQAKETGVSRIIWDIREAELDYSLIGSHGVVMNLDALGLSRDNFVAVIYMHNKEQHQHAGTVARNRGIINIGYFQNLDEGINWLISKG